MRESALTHSVGVCEKRKIESRACNEHDCHPLDCVLSDWLAASECSVACGNGTQQWERHVMQKAVEGGKCSSRLSEARACSGQLCPVDCEVSMWSQDAPCNVSCGSGHELWTRTVLEKEKNGGSCTVPLAETRSCVGTDCCSLGPWFQSGKCDAPCGGYGFELFERDVLAGDCSGAKLKSKHPCASKCQCQYEFDGWTPCCHGTQSRLLELIKTQGSESCPLLKVESRVCKGHFCPTPEPVHFVSDVKDDQPTTTTTMTQDATTEESSTTTIAAPTSEPVSRFVDCLENTDKACSMNCDWCNDTVHWTQRYDDATDLFFFPSDGPRTVALVE